jgi:hypothetical protein
VEKGKYLKSSSQGKKELKHTGIRICRAFAGASGLNTHIFGNN